MESAAAFETAWTGRPARERTGRVELLVLRKGGGVHETPPAVELCPEGGVIGDRWSAGDDPNPEDQVTLMDVEVARLIAGDKPLHLPGDNVLVDLDLDVENAPIGTRIRLGEGALVEISPLPHNGCDRFADRFGVEALKWINAKAHRARRLRGVNCRVLEAGTIRIGDLARPE